MAEPFISIETQLLYRYLDESRPPVNLKIGGQNFILTDYRLESGKIIFFSTEISDFLACVSGSEIKISGDFYFNGRGMNFETLLIKNKSPYIVFPLYFNKNISENSNGKLFSLCMNFMGYSGEVNTENFKYNFINSFNEYQKKIGVLSSIQKWINQINNKSIIVEDFNCIRAFLFYFDEKKGIVVFYDSEDRFVNLSGRDSEEGWYTLTLKGREIDGCVHANKTVRKKCCIITEFSHKPNNPEDFRFLFEVFKEKKCLDDEIKSFFDNV